ncbi:MAG TPA: PIN domain-containing protein [Tepidisphaeraceae bacterium]|jgi:predicted nucleic acid-binding protein
MKVLLDVNIVLDVLLDRPPWVDSAKDLWQACDDARVEGYVSAISLPTLFYIVRKVAGLQKARKAVRLCLDAFEVCAVNGQILEIAYATAGSDFEDNVQVASAVAAGVDFIVSRDLKGLTNSQIPVRGADEIMKLL